MSKKVFVGGLAWATTDDSLRAAFESFGNVVDAKVIIERETGRSRGFGFVTFDNEASANEAMSAMNGQTLDGRTIRVNPADDSGKKSGNRPQRADSAQRTPDVVQRRDGGIPQARRNFGHDEFAYSGENTNPRRENRKKDKKKRDRFEDDDRW